MKIDAHDAVCAESLASLASWEPKMLPILAVVATPTNSCQSHCSSTKLMRNGQTAKRDCVEELVGCADDGLCGKIEAAELSCHDRDDFE